MGWTITEHGRNLHAIQFPVSAERDQHFLLMSDLHIESPYCDWDLAARHLDEAKDLGAIVLDNGDCFDLMQGKYDKRSDTRELRPELVGGPGTYLEECVKFAAERLRPYRHLLAVRGVGNHESSVTKRAEWNVAQQLVTRLRDDGATRCHLGGYGGFIVLQPMSSATQQRSLDLYYHHGEGGGGPVTRGVIGTNRRAVYVDADIIWTAHVHESWTLRTHRLKRLKSMHIVQREQVHVCTPGYKNEFQDGHGGYHVETGKPPKPLGAYWLRVHRTRSREGSVAFDFREAK